MKELEKKYLSVKDYATKKKVSVQNVYQQLKRGKLKGKKFGSFQFVIDE
jgi:hypothetical protein